MAMLCLTTTAKCEIWKYGTQCDCQLMIFVVVGKNNLLSSRIMVVVI